MQAHPYQRWNWLLSLVVLLAFSIQTLKVSAQKQSSYPQEWAPWNRTIDTAYFFKVSPLSQAPSRPPQYFKDNRPQMPFVGGDGFLIVSKYAESPAGMGLLHVAAN
jgi:hypothetical protein